MKRGLLVFIALFIGGTLILLPNFYRNRWTAVEPEYYAEWQTRYDRLVVARLVKTRQDGFLSAGGLMGLGDEKEWGFETRTNRHQFNTYLNKGEFRSYLVYKSNPGLQGVFYGAFDQVSPLTGEQNIKLFRGFTALTSAMVLGLILAALAVEFGILSGLLTLVFTVFSMWIVLPAGSIFWDLWAFYLPFAAGAYLLADSARKYEYNSARIHSVLFITVLTRFLFSGFDMTTTVLVMTTVPFVFHGIYHKWDGRTFVVRMVKVGIVLTAATLTGLVILLLQIIANEGSIARASEYILNRFSSHTGGNYEYFTNQEVEVRTISAFEVLSKYLLMPAIDLRFRNISVHVLYWHLLVVFALFTLISISMHRIGSQRLNIPRKTLALMSATWYSILAPLSWYVLFKPHSFIHTHVNTMAWQMPFTILGFALCGLVITDLLTVHSRRSQSVSDAS
jgi:hypothetical protein